MGNYVRTNAWDAANGGQFQDQNGNYTSLYWYAKAVGTMMERDLNDPTSWWFFGAIHGQYIVDNDGGGAPPVDFPNWGKIPPAPQVPTTPLPDASVRGQYWDQCQHAGWYFAPWHRGYLYALENILRECVEKSGGPSDWALPYWNYLKKGTNQYQMPPAFALKNLPDGSPNPLYVTARYGPNGNGSIYVPIPPVSQTCQQETVYTGKYGGGKTGFEHFDSSTGALEQNPHNLVHSFVGGQVSGSLWGLMSDPGLAALDPIFYLHHCNIDRLWAAWNAASNNNPTDQSWLDGPTASGERKFYMPDTKGSAWLFTPEMVNDITKLNYTYDDLGLGISPTLVSSNLLRLRKLGKATNETLTDSMENKESSHELIGANESKVHLGAEGANVKVKMDASTEKVKNSLLKASVSNIPDEVYLQLEGVKGVNDSNVYTVSVNQQYAGHISLFGLRKASAKGGHHGGTGLTIRIDITEIVDKLHLNEELSDSLDVLIQPVSSQPQDNSCTIDRVSIYRSSK